MVIIISRDEFNEGFATSYKLRLSSVTDTYLHNIIILPYECVLFINKNVPNHILVPQPATVMSELGPNFKILPATDQIRELQTIIR